MDTAKGSGLEPRPITRREKLVGYLTGRAISYLAERARKRGDWHEYNHCAAGLVAGNSNHLDRPCPFPRELHEGPGRFGGLLAVRGEEVG